LARWEGRGSKFANRFRDCTRMIGRRFEEEKPMLCADVERSFSELCLAASHGGYDVIDDRLRRLLARNDFLDFGCLERVAYGYSPSSHASSVATEYDPL